MPRDPRLYMTFPNDMHRHPKISRLPVAVRWTFFEMNGEARIADNDGIFTIAEAEYLWPVKHLEQLVASHPERPLVVRDGDTYVIREYAEHQQTREERAQLAERNRANGMKGGRPRKNPVGTQSVTSRNPVATDSKATETQPKAEIEIELTTKDSSSPSVMVSEFERVWLSWPKKTEKKAALEQFARAVKKLPLDELTGRIVLFGDRYAVTTERKYVPALGVWLRHERWTDELPTASTQVVVPSSAPQQPSAPDPGRRDPSVYCRHWNPVGTCPECEAS